MKVTVLGSSAAYAGPADACSGYLVEHGDAKVLLDCGTGVISSLQDHVEVGELTHIVISHMHADHFFDLIPLHYALWRGSEKTRQAKPRLLLPPSGLHVLQQVGELAGSSFVTLENVFTPEEYRPGASHDLGGVEAEFTPTEHFIPAYAITLRGGSRRVTYSADSRPCPALVQAAQDADLFLCEATIFDAADTAGRRGHMMAHEAAEVARRAGVDSLVLTHFWPDCDRAQSQDEARSVFSGATEVAHQGSSFSL